MKKELFIFSLLFILLIGFVSAVWWNPFTWGEKEVSLSAVSEELDSLCRSIGRTSSCNVGTFQNNCESADSTSSDCPNGKEYFFIDCTGPYDFPEVGILGVYCKDGHGMINDCDGDGYVSGSSPDGLFCPPAYDCDDSSMLELFDMDTGISYPCPDSPSGCNDSTRGCSICSWENKFFYVDSDRDGYVRDIYPNTNIYYPGDGVIDERDRIELCVGSIVPPGYVESVSDMDCDDGSKSINPGESELCLIDTGDEDCDWNATLNIFQRFSDCSDSDCNNEICDIGKRCCGSCTSEKEVDFTGAGSQCKICSGNEVINKPDGIASCTNSDGNTVEYNPGIQEIGCCGGSCGILIRYYWDSDGDGYPDETNYEDVCSPEDLSHDVGSDQWFNNGPFDCDDGDVSKWNYLIGFKDSDGDGYGLIPPEKVCSNETLPIGYVENALDCDDGDVSIIANSPYPLGTNPLDNLCKKCGSVIKNDLINPITGELMEFVSVGFAGFDRNLNTKEMNNCFYCKPNDLENPENDLTSGGIAEFIENNKMGDGDCFYCNPSSSNPELDLTTEPFGLYYNSEGKLTSEFRVLKNPLPDISVCACTISFPDGSFEPCCYDLNTQVSSDSLRKIYPGGFDWANDCKTCDWKEGTYQYRKLEQANLVDSDEDPKNDGGNCSYCGTVDGVYGLQADVNDSRFLGIPPAGGDSYYCKKCSDTGAFWIADDLDKRVKGEPYDINSDTTCKVCENGNLKNEKNLEVANFCPGCPTSLSSADQENLESRRCCGGDIYNDQIDGCCPTSLTGNSEIDDYAGELFEFGIEKCCRENIITANDKGAGWRNVLTKQLVYSIPLGGSVLYSYISEIDYLGPDGIITQSETTRKVVENNDADYCSGIGYGATYKTVFGNKKISTDDSCTACQPSQKTNMLVFDAINALGSNLGYTGWLASQAGMFLSNYKNLDTILGFRGNPRYNRVCYEVPASISLLPGGTSASLSKKNDCGECDSMENKNLNVKTEIKFPFSVFGVTVFRTFNRKTNEQCNKAFIDNGDSSKFASASLTLPSEGSGCYWCNPEGMCEVQNELVPGFLKYWTRKVIAAFSLYQSAHGVLQALDKNQGGEVVDSSSASVDGGTNADGGGTEIIPVLGGGDTVLTPVGIIAKFFP